jgi:hypothetical protein
MKTLFKISRLFALTLLMVMASSIAAQAAEIPQLVYIIPAGSLALGFMMHGQSLAFTAIAPMSVHDLRAFAQKNLSNFNGDEDNFEGFEGMSFYTGDNDDFVDFGGNNRNFALESAEGREFVITLTAPAEGGNVYIIPGLSYYNNRTANGFLTNTGGKTTAGAALASAAGSPSNITDFYDFLSYNPVNLLGIKVSSSDASQLDKIVVYEEQSPFRVLTSRNINLGSISDQNTYQDKKGKIATPGIILSNQTRVTLPVPGSATTTMTFYCGAVMNSSQALHNKRDKAQNSISTLGATVVKGLAGANRPFPSTKRLGK